MQKIYEWSCDRLEISIKMHTNAHIMCTMCTGHVMLVNALYIIVDFFLNTIRGFCVALWWAAANQLRPAEVAAQFRRLIWINMFVHQLSFYSHGSTFTCWKPKLFSSKNSRINSQSIVLMKLPACQATNEAKTRFCLFSVFLSDLDL